jgi:Zn-dependent protease
MSTEPPPSSPAACPVCSTQWGPGLLACPGCSRLVHAEALKQIAAAAEAATRDQDLPAALREWRSALPLLPADSRQFAAVSGRIDQLAARVAAGEGSASPVPVVAPAADAPPGSSRQPSTAWLGKGVAGAGALAALAFKFKFLLVFVLTKAKLLLAGLTNATTFMTMLASLGVYWAQFGWKFAAGLVVSLYIHEMGHATAMRRYGLPASAPMFIPGLGAFIRLKQSPRNALENARIGLAGPTWGTIAALIAYGLGEFNNWPAWSAIGHFGAWINLFNLLPVWQLDGSQGLTALARPARVALVVIIAVLWHYTNEGLLALIMIVAAIRVFTDRGSEKTDLWTAAQFAWLLAVLACMCYRSAGAG